MAIPGNPYIAGSPVGDTPAFVGRAVALREVLHVLSRPRDNAIVLYGQRRIGKTSILQYLEAWLPDEGPYCPVYFDLEDKAALPLNQVLWELARVIAHTLGKPDLDLGSDPEVAFRDEWLPAVLDDLPEDCSLVLLFDEFDVLADPQRQEAAKAFFSYLRTLLTVDPRRLQFVFVIGRNVGDLDNIAVSLFKGIPTEQVSLLDREDTVDLIHLSEANGTLRWPDEAAERVWALTCGHPYLTQQLCSHVWHRAYDEEDGEPDELPTVAAADVDAAVLDALESGRGTLEWLWRGLPPAERVVAAALAEAGPDPITQQELEGLLTESGVRIVIRELQNAPHLLQEWDLIEPADGGYRFRVELLRRWIADHKPLQRVQDELDRIEPVAENYYQAAVGLYRGGELDQAIAPLRQAISLNPNHVGANQLLADILLAQGQVDEARQLLERLYGYQPAAARPRLVQAILTQAQAAESDDEQLALYRQVLELAPAQREATTKVAEIQPRLVQAILTQAQAAESDDEQLALYRQVLELAPAQREATAKVAEIQLKQLEGLEQQRRYQSALDLARQLAEKYPGMRDWTPDLKRLERKTHLDDLYQRALGALQSGDRGTAQTLLAKVVTEEPGYEEAARYLHEAVTGKRVPWQLIVSGLLLIVSIVLTAWTLARLGSLSAPAVSSFTIDQPRQLGAQQEHASVSGYLDYSDNVPLTEMGIVVYVTGVKPDREGKWRRSSIPCATQVGRQWAVSSDCTAFPGEYTEFSLKAVLVAGGEAARLPLELAASGEDELTSELSKYAYPCSNSAPCNSISPMFQVSRTDVEPTATPTSSPTPSPTPTSTPTPRPTFTPTPSRTPSPSPTSRPTPIVTPTPTYTATATLPPPTDTQRPLPSPTDTPTPTNTKPPPPTSTKPPPPTSTKPPPPTNTKRPPPTNTKPAP